MHKILYISLIAVVSFTTIDARPQSYAPSRAAVAVPQTASSGWDVNQIRSEHRRKNAMRGDASTLCSDLCNKDTCRDPRHASRCIVACRAAIYKKNTDGSYAVNAKGNHVPVPAHHKTQFGTQMNTKAINRAYSACKKALESTGQPVPAFVSTTVRQESVPPRTEPIAVPPQAPRPDLSIRVPAADPADESPADPADDFAEDYRSAPAAPSAADRADEPDDVSPASDEEDSVSPGDYNAVPKVRKGNRAAKPAPVAPQSPGVKKEDSWLGGWFGKASPPAKKETPARPTASPARTPAAAPGVDRSTEARTPSAQVVNYEPVSVLARDFATKANATPGREGDRAMAAAIVLEHMVQAITHARKAEGVRSTAVLNTTSAEMERTIRKLQELFMHANADEQKMIASVINMLSGVDKLMDSSKD